MTKICIKCGKEKDVEEFSKHATNKDGYNKKCKTCVNEYGRLHRSKNLQRERRRSAKYYKKNKKTLLAKINKKDKSLYAKNYRNSNKEKLKIKRQKYYKLNKERLIKEQSERYRKRIKNDVIFKLKKEVQGLIRDSFRRKDLSKNNKRTVQILGCTIQQFKTYLESKFESWMNWNNKGLYNGTDNFGWDIDHIVPIATAKNESDIIKLNHYTNLQPLCSNYNRNIKRAKKF